MMAIDPAREYTLPREQIVPQVTPARPTPHVTRVSDLSRAQTRDRLGLIMTLLVCMGIAIYLVSRYATLVADNYQIESMKSTLTHQLTRDASLQSTVYELSSPTRILTIATTILHMKSATPVVVGNNP